MYQIVQKRKWWYTLSGLALAASVAFIALGGLKFSIDFTGGSLLRLSFSERPAAADLLTIINAQNVGTASIQTLGDTEYNIRLPEITADQHQQLLGAITETYSDMTEQSFQVIGPIIGSELRQKAVTAIFLVLLGIILYLIWAFRSSRGTVPSWKFGMNAIIALIHDITITVGVFAALGYFFNVEIDILFVTALLTILGFSVHDTIVVFDRFREQARVSAGTVEELANASVNQTLVRSINTSSTTMFVLLALFLFGGDSIHYFVLALLVGIVVGTYSSIFIASPLLVTFTRRR